jgi:hypothetical protein
METALLESAGGDGFSVTLELVFGHGWGSAEVGPVGEYRIEPDAIGLRRS